MYKNWIMINSMDLSVLISKFLYESITKACLFGTDHVTSVAPLYEHTDHESGHILRSLYLMTAKIGNIQGAMRIFRVNTGI